MLKSDYIGYQIEEAASAEIVSSSEAARLREFHSKVEALMAVDDFDPSEIGRRQDSDAAPVKLAAASKKKAKKKTAAKKTASKKKAKKKAKKKTD